MAGIGFELKKLFRRDGIFSTIFAGFYATMVTTGPTILVILAINLMYLLLPYSSLSWYEQELLTSIILYVFIFSLVISSPVNIILSRYIADKIFQEDYDSILPAVDAANLAVALLVFCTGVPFGLAMYYIGGISVFRIAVSYIFYAGLAFSFYYMSLVTLLKEYRKITGSFLVSMGTGILLSMFAVYILKTSVVDAVLTGMAVGFNLVAVLMISCSKKNFRTHNKNSGEIWGYFRKFWKLFAANAFYVLGLYCSNFVFWAFSKYQIVVAGIFVSAPVYDVATYLAMLSNITVLVLFVVNVETKFHTAYQDYCQAVIGASGKDILQTRRRMGGVLRRELLYIIQTQLLINVCIVLLVLAFGGRLGFSGTILDMYPSLAVGYMIIYLVQCMMIFLFYFDDAGGAAVVGLIFLAGSVAGSLIFVRTTEALAGCGVILGAFLGFSAAFFRIKYMLSHLEEHIYCRGELKEKSRRRRGRGKKGGNVSIYSRTSTEG